MTLYRCTQVLLFTLLVSGGCVRSVNNILPGADASAGGGDASTSDAREASIWGDLDVFGGKQKEFGIPVGDRSVRDAGSGDQEPAPDAPATCLGDGDCDDRNPCTIDLCVPFGAAKRCRNLLWDEDLDGEAPDHLGDCGSDCDDLDPLVFAGQTKFFTDPRGGDGTFDYNCDGQESLQFESLYSGCNDGDGCSGSGWLGDVPGCGAQGSLRRCLPDPPDPHSCDTDDVTATAACR